jgi:hypothetical protein
MGTRIGSWKTERKKVINNIHIRAYVGRIGKGAIKGKST